MSWLKPRPTKNFGHFHESPWPENFEDIGSAMRRAEGSGKASSKPEPFLHEPQKRFGTPASFNFNQPNSGAARKDSPPGQNQKLCRAYGAKFSWPFFPALTGWASFCRASGAREMKLAAASRSLLVKIH